MRSWKSNSDDLWFSPDSEYMTQDLSETRPKYKYKYKSCDCDKPMSTKCSKPSNKCVEKCAEVPKCHMPCTDYEDDMPSVCMPKKDICCHENPDACTEPLPSCLKMAHAYVPWQHYGETFCPEQAFDAGTLFPDLYGVYPIPQ